MCLLSHNVITTCINLHLLCEIRFWTLIEIFCFYTMFITFVRWRLSVGIKRFTYLLTSLTYLLDGAVCQIKWCGENTTYHVTWLNLILDLEKWLPRACFYGAFLVRLYCYEFLRQKCHSCAGGHHWNNTVTAVLQCYNTTNAARRGAFYGSRGTSRQTVCHRKVGPPQR